VGANQCRASHQRFRIPTGPRALGVRARNWVAIEVCGHRSPNHGYGVRPRRSRRVSCVQPKVGRLPNTFASLPGRVHWRAARENGWPYQYVAIELKPRVRRASRTRQPGVRGANQSGASPQQVRIPTRPRALAVRARNWVAIEVCGHRSPNHGSGVRPRRDRAGVVGANQCGASSHSSASLLRRVHWRAVRENGWPYQYVAIELKPRVRRASRTRQAGVRGANQICGVPPALAQAFRARTWVAIEVSCHRSPNHAFGVRPRRDHRVWRVQTDGGGPPKIFHPNHATCSAHSCTYSSGHRSIWP